MDAAQAPHFYLSADRNSSDKSHGVDNIYSVFKKKKMPWRRNIDKAGVPGHSMTCRLTNLGGLGVETDMTGDQ